MAKLTVGPARISYAYLFEPRPATAPGQTSKYGCQVLIPKSATKTVAAIQGAIAQCKADYLNKNPKGTWINNAKVTFYDGDGPRPNGDAYGPEAKGHFVISASNHKQPLVVGTDKQPVLNRAEVYSGCFGLCVLDFYAFDKAGNKGIACSLQGFMKTQDGDPLGGGGVSDSDWSNVAANDLNEALSALLA